MNAAHSIDPGQTSLTLYGERPITRFFFDLIQQLFSRNVLNFLHGVISVGRGLANAPHNGSLNETRDNRCRFLDCIQLRGPRFVRRQVRASGRRLFCRDLVSLCVPLEPQVRSALAGHDASQRRSRTCRAPELEPNPIGVVAIAVVAGASVLDRRRRTLLRRLPRLPFDSHIPLHFEARHEFDIAGCAVHAGFLDALDLGAGGKFGLFEKM